MPCIAALRIQTRLLPTMVLASAVLFQFTYHVRNGGRFLADSDIDTFDTGIALVDDGIDSQCGFTGLMSPMINPTLTTTDWDQAESTAFITGLYRLIH